jgi:hypothetical protein
MQACDEDRDGERDGGEQRDADGIAVLVRKSELARLRRAPDTRGKLHCVPTDAR